MNHPPTSHESGITAIEVLIAATLAIVLALLLWPKWIRSTLAANEAAALVTMRQIGDAERTYAVTYPAIGFASSLEQLHATGLLRESLPPQFSANGYQFAAQGIGPEPRTSFLSTAAPVQVGRTGQLSFCGTNRWVIHYRSVGSPTADTENCESWPVAH